MGKALSALMIMLGILLLIATLYDVALRVNPALVPEAPVAPEGGVVTVTKVETLTVTSTKAVTALMRPNVPAHTAPSQLYVPPSEAVVLNLSGSPANTSVRVTVRMNYSVGLLRNVTLTAVGTAEFLTWNSTFSIHVRIFFNPSLPNGTELEVLPVWIPGMQGPMSVSISQHNLPMRGEVSRLNISLWYPRQHLPSLIVFTINVRNYLKGPGALDSFILILKTDKLSPASGIPSTH